jgi:hypothetical protein
MEKTMKKIIYLYLKTHNKTGLKYLGKTTQDPFKYPGSGKIWKDHIKKHGHDITTKILFETDDLDKFIKIAIYYSRSLKVVESEEFANLMIEKGDGAPAGHNYNILKVIDGTHHWLGDKNPSHKRIKEGSHNFQKQNKESKICEYCKQKVDFGNYSLYHGKYCYNYTGLMSDGAIQLKELAGKHVKNTFWITDGIENKRIHGNSCIPEGWKRGKTIHNLSGLKEGGKKRKGKPLAIVKCPHCYKEGGVSQMKQWHFDKCKQKKE